MRILLVILLAASAAFADPPAADPAPVVSRVAASPVTLPMVPAVINGAVVDCTACLKSAAALAPPSFWTTRVGVGVAIGLAVATNLLATAGSVIGLVTAWPR